MLLKALYEYSEKLELFKNVHLQPKDVHILIPINIEGEIVGEGIITLHSINSKKKQVLGKSCEMPRFPGENNGGKAYFIAESINTIVGFDKNGKELKVEEKLANSAKSFKHFWKRIELAYEETELDKLGAILKFKEKYLYVEEGRIRHRLPFIETKITDSGKAELGVKTASGGWESLSKASLVATFKVEEDLVFTGEATDPLTLYWKKKYNEEAFLVDKDNSAKETKDGSLCMVTGLKNQTIARSHKPKLLKIPGMSSGGYIVSFSKESPSFSSYRFEMGENAPVSERAASSYVLALQHLLNSEHQSIRIVNAVVCFWTKANSLDEEDFFFSKLNEPSPLAVSEFLKAPFAGISRELVMKDRFYSVTLSGNAGRVIVRNWIDQPVEEAVKNLTRWFSDLDITELYKKKKEAKKKGDKPSFPFSLFDLARCTIRDAKNLQPDIVNNLYRAAVEGTSPSVMLLKPILDEFTSQLVSGDKKKYPFSLSRFALIKLILNRNRKEREPMIEKHLFETDDKAYNCGRLLAILADSQAKAHEYKLKGAGVVERYYGTASVSPSLVFPVLLKLYRHHIDKIRKSDRFKSHANYIENDIAQIFLKFKPENDTGAPEFPRHLDLQSQGRFAIGFYQQKAQTTADRNKQGSEQKQ